MPLTAAERQRRYREKLKSTNPEKFQDQKKKNSDRTLRQYKNKTANYNEEQKEELRKKWREDRKKNENAPSISQQHAMKNPNQSITDIQTLYKLQRRNAHKFQKENILLKRKINYMMNGFNNLLRKVQRQQKVIETLNINYENIMMELDANKTKETDKREEESVKYYKNTKETDETPNKRVNDFINQTVPYIETPKKEEIKKKLLEHDLLQESFKNEYKNCIRADKEVLKRVVISDIMKKYKKTTKFKVKLGIQTSAYRKLEEGRKKKVQLQKQIAFFFKRDDVSRATAGKKEYKTYKKIKFQKRYLLDKLKNLHRKYVEEVGRVSFSTFKKYRPFYVLPPNIKDCESCACTKHSNMQFLIDNLHSFGLLKSNNLNDVVQELVCDSKSKRCMYDDCSDCSKRKIDNGNLDPNTQVKWFKWALTDYEYGKEGNMKKSKKMMKTIKEGTLEDLLETFNEEIKPFKKHVFNFYYQYKQYKLCAENLQEHEALIHIDFSENYVCKYHQEVQAKHFVKDQITLHTGVLYVKNQKPISFCSISPDNTHNPESIWAHLDPILNYVKNNHPDINTIHFFSDGPATQYKQKKNFFLFSRNIYDYGFSTSSWSFFEAAHGKGAADGVGGAIKRTLDMKTAQGQDIPDAKAAYDALLSTETKIKIFYVPAENIKPLDPLIVENLMPIPGTMKIHQLITCGQYKIKYRDLSCFCKDIRETCACHSPTFHDFSTLNKTVKGKRNRKRCNSPENNRNTAQKSKKKVKRHRKQSSSSSEDDINMEIEFAESDCDDDFPSDGSMFSDLNLHIDENLSGDNLDRKFGITQTCINPNKKIHILSTVIIKNPTQTSNISKLQEEDENQNKLQNRKYIKQEKSCQKQLSLVDKENYIKEEDLIEINKTARTQTDPVNKVDEEKIVTVDGCGGCTLKKTVKKKTKKRDENNETETNEENKTDLNANQERKQPQLLKELSLKFVNQFLLHEDKTVNSNLINVALKKKTKKKTLASKVRSLREVSKTDNENLPFVAVCKGDLPKSLQTSKSSDYESGSLLKSAKKARINVLSTSNMAVHKVDLPKSLQMMKTVECGSGSLSKSVKTSVLKTILIPRNQENIKFNKKKKEKYKTKKPSRCSSSTTSVSDNMSVHTDSSIIDVEMENDTENSPLCCFEQARPLSACNYISVPDDFDDQMSYDIMKWDNIDLCDSKMQNQYEPDFSQDQSKVSTQEECPKLDTCNKSRPASLLPVSDTSQLVKNSDSQASRPPTNKNDAVLSDKIPSPTNNESEQTAYDYSVNNKVLVRYYARNKTWKYYIGVITAVNADQTFDISFYATTRNKGEIKFKKPKKIDRGTVPKTLIVKIIEIDRISDRIEEYTLHDPADGIYF